MGLIHWWDLNNNLLDKVDNTSLTNSGATISNGKIGKCYYFNGASNLKRTYSASTHPLGSYPKKFSFAFWIKLSTSWTGWGQAFTIGMEGTSWNDIRIGLDINNDKLACFSISDGTNSVGSAGPRQALSVDTWYHLAATFDNGMMRLYVNGEDASTLGYKEITYTPNLSNATIIAIGGNKTELGECYMNDVRVYDHALSRAEVKELCKAMVIHYSFNDRLSEPTTNHSILSQWGHFTSYWTPIETTSTGWKLKKTSMSSSSTVAISNSTIFGKMAVGDVWTISCYLYKNNKPILADGTTFSTWMGSIPTLNYEKRNDGYFSVTFRIDSKTNAYPIHAPIFGSDFTLDDVYEIRNLQVEKLDHPTFYTNGSRTGIKLFNETCLTQPSEIVGYNLSSDAAIGDRSLSCNGETHITHTISGDVSQGASASMWIKDMDIAGKYVVFADINSKLAFGPYGSYSIMSCAGKTTARLTNASSLWKSFDWNHVVVRVDASGNYSCFINGTECTYSTDTDNWTHTQNTVIAARNNNGTYGWPLTGKIDDFRLYYSYLSNDDIKKLYNTRVSVTPSYTALLTSPVDEKRNTFTPKTNLLEMVSLIEPSTMKLTDGSEWLCIFNHELRDDKTYFTNATEAGLCTSAENRYSLLNYISQFKSTDNKYEFLLAYPDRGPIQSGYYNRWTQTSDPNAVAAGSVAGFTAITTKWSSYNKGIAKSSSSATYMNTNAGGGTWFGAIGQYSRWTSNSTSQIPAADGSSSESTQLWIRTDNTSYKGYFKTYDNGAMLASNLEEI